MSKKVARKLNLEGWSDEADTLRRRMLMMKDFDVWVPLIRDPEFFKKTSACNLASCDFVS